MISPGFAWALLLLIAIGVPIVFALGVTPMAAFLLAGRESFLPVVAQRLYTGINQFPLLAIPLFILAGEIMNVGGITSRLVRFANALVGHLRGGLAHVNIVSSIFFAGLSGSAVADASALGSMLVPAMEKQGYTRRFAAAVTAASSVIGPIIPPSIIMVIYAYIMQVSVAGLFLAGIVPGILTGLGLMAVTRLMADRLGLPPARTVPETGFTAPRIESWAARLASGVTVGLVALALFPETWGWLATLLAAAAAFAAWAAFHRLAPAAFREISKGAVLPLLTPVIILGGILSGVFTPTEAAGAAVVYALLLSILVLRTLAWSQMQAILMRTALASSVILLAVGTASIFGWAATISGIPNAMADFVFALTENPLLLLLCINVLLLLIGMFLDAGPAILILGPILGPLALEMGIDPIHFAIIMCVNLTIGLATPPMGLILFVTSTVSGERVEYIAREMLPFYAVHVAIIALVTYVPTISLSLPRWFGFA
jgi:TRAP-type C4-dicarboxylate transport system permease large subunit